MQNVVELCSKIKCKFCNAMCTEQFIEVFGVQKNASCDFSVVSLVYVVQCGVCSKMLVVQ